MFPNGARENAINGCPKNFKLGSEGWTGGRNDYFQKIQINVTPIQEAFRTTGILPTFSNIIFEAKKWFESVLAKE